MRRRFLNNNIKSISNYHLEYFTIEALEDGLTASLSVNACEYSLDGNTWNSLSAATNTPAVNTGEKIYFRGNLTPTSNGVGTFTISKRCNVKGNIMSLLYGDNFEGQIDLTGKDYIFYNLFYNCTNIIDASELILPATTLAQACYESMFQGCTNLINAPELPATTLSSYCYYYMYWNCPNISEITMLATDISASNCLTYWTNGVAKTGTFIKHPDMNDLPTGASGIPQGWTVLDYIEPDYDLITFTIGGTEYQAKEGMTWGEWIKSEYNIDGYNITSTNNYIVDSSYDFYVKLVKDNRVFCTSEMLIIEDENYVLDLY